MKYSSKELLIRLNGLLRGSYGRILVFDELDSTNSYLKRKADDLPDRTLVLALTQTSGRGRLGREFVSPDGGLYFSVLFKDRPAVDPGPVTVCASVAVAEAIEKYCGVTAGIKWVNDVCVDGKKVCGILCEAVTSGGRTSIVCGIGINLLRPDNGYPAQISGRAGALSDFCVVPDPAVLAGEIAVKLRELPTSLPAAIIEKYRSRSFVCGKRVSVISNGIERPAKAISIEDDASLLVEYDDQTREKLTYGEISIIPQGEDNG